VQSRKRKKTAGFFGVLLVMAIVSGCLYMPVQADEGGDVEITVNVTTNVGIMYQIWNVQPNEEMEGKLLEDYPGAGEEQARTIGADKGLSVGDTVYVVIEPSLDFSNTYNSITINGAVQQGVVNGVYSNVFPVVIGDDKTINIAVSGSTARCYSIIWANSDAASLPEGYDNADARITNGRAYVERVFDRNGVEITANISNIGNNCVNNGLGYIAVEEGWDVVFRFVPDAGYQLTSITANDTALEPQEALNTYRYTMPNTPIHFSAVFTQTEDVVAATAENISEGSIMLANGELEAGTARLEVNNASPAEAQCSAFEAMAEDSGCEVAQYLDISLYNIFYKGTTNPDNAWAVPMETLDEAANITLTLGNATVAGEVYIIHEYETNDGYGYEVITPVYNTETGVLSFATDGFSNYAIVCSQTPEAGAVYTIDFESGSWDLGDTTVTAPGDTSRELGMDDIIWLEGFNPEWMDAYLEADDGGRCYLEVNEDGSTTIASGGEAVPPAPASLRFGVEERNTYPYDIVMEGSEQDFLDSLILTDAEIQLLNNGAEITGEMIVVDITHEDDQEIVGWMESVSQYASEQGNCQMALFMDIILRYEIDGNEQYITETSQPLRFSFAVPAEFINTDPLIVRNYRLFRLHGNTVEEIDCNFDAEFQRILFESDRFSVYGLAYEDHIVSQSGGGNPTGNGGTGGNASSPSSGDENQAGGTTVTGREDSGGADGITVSGNEGEENGGAGSISDNHTEEGLSSPQTGETWRVYLWGLLIYGGTIAGICLTKRKRKQHK